MVFLVPDAIAKAALAAVLLLLSLFMLLLLLLLLSLLLLLLLCCNVVLCACEWRRVGTACVRRRAAGDVARRIFFYIQAPYKQVSCDVPEIVPAEQEL